MIRPKAYNPISTEPVRCDECGGWATQYVRFRSVISGYPMTEEYVCDKHANLNHRKALPGSLEYTTLSYVIPS